MLFINTSSVIFAKYDLTTGKVVYKMTQKFSDPESGWTTDLQNGVSLNELVNCCSNDE